MTEDINIEGLNLTSLGSASEMDLSAESGEVIDPKVVSAAIVDNEESKNLANETLIEDEELQIEDDLSIGIDSPLEEEEKSKEEEAPKKSDELTTPAEEEVETFRVLGQHFNDEGILDGFDEEMENTPEAFESMVSKTVENKIQEYKDNLANPISKQFLDYLENDGDPSQFMQLVSGPNYSQVNTETLSENEAMQKQILRAYYQEQGESAEDAEETIQAFEDAGNLDKRSNVALVKLQKMQQAQMDNEMQKQQQSKADQQQKVEEYIKTLETDINKREEIAGFSLTKKDKSKFFDYITKINPKTGTTDLLTDSQDQEKQLQMSFLYYNNFKFDKIEKKAKAKAAVGLSEKLGRFTDTSRKQASRKKTPAVNGEQGEPNLAAMKSLFG